MAIVQIHIPFYKELFAIPNLLSEPVLVFGFQEIAFHGLIHQPYRDLGLRDRIRKAHRAFRRRWDAARGAIHPDLVIPDEFRVPDLVQFIQNRGVKDFEVIDLFDSRATLNYDMNEPVPNREHGRYGSLLDIGCLEHVFDTRQCLENCFRMLRKGGMYFLHTVVNGYFMHGLHVFNPEALLGALGANGFEIVYLRYSNARDVPIDNPGSARDALIWVVARTQEEHDRFVSPQQGVWPKAYAKQMECGGGGR